MRRMCLIYLLLAAILMTVSCQRRPFSDASSAVNLKLKINTKVVHEEDINLPDLMCVQLCDIHTGDVVYTDYVPPTGGYIYPEPGHYDFLVYNINTESTVLKNEANFNTVEAYTNPVSAFIKSQLSQFLAKRAEIRKQMAAKKEERQNKSSESPADDSKAPEEEVIVNEPDHLFVGRSKDVVIPAFAVDEDTEIVIEMDAATVVETWLIEAVNIEGLQWVSSVSALITGMVESNFIGPGEKSEGAVTIYFEMSRTHNSLIGYYRTFGKHPLFSNDLTIGFNVTDTQGGEHHFIFDITDEYLDNPERHIIITDKIVIPEPIITGGGFAPTVDDWEEVKTDINL